MNAASTRNRPVGKLLCALGATLLAAPAWAHAADLRPHPQQQQQRQQQAARNVEREINLSAPKADAVFALLAPDHVRVVVGRTPQGVQVRGTSAEISALAEFSGLLVRHEGQDLGADEAALDKLRESWDAVAIHTLPEPSAQTLYDLLAMNDVPVFVSKAGDGISVEATQADQKVIADFVRIVRGETIADSAPPAPPRPNRPARRNQDDAQRKIAALEHRVQQLEERIAKLESEFASARDHHDEHAKAEQPSDAPKEEKKPTAANLIDRRYKLPPHHADNVFALFAPADITDVIVSREGNQLRIRASAQDQKTIARLVDILTRGENKPADNSRADAESASGEPNG